jgi:hypothetical protein
MIGNFHARRESTFEMSRQLRIEYPGAFYHVTSRGNRGQLIFEDDRDRLKFLEYIGEAHEKAD